MTASATAWGTTVATTSGSTWTNTANATGTNNATFATFTNATSGAVGYIQLSGYPGSINGGVAPASVDSVVVQVWGYVATAARWASASVQLVSSTGALIGTSQPFTLSATTTNSQTLTFTGVTWAQVSAGLQVRISATKTGTQSSTFNVDAASMVVNYTAATGGGGGGTGGVTRVQTGVTNFTYDSVATTTSLAVTLPAAATAGNVLVAAWGIDKNGGSFTPPAGWTTLLNQPGTSTSLYIAYKIAAGGETSATGTWATAIAGAAAFIAEYSGADTSNPFGPNDLPVYSDTARTSMSFVPATPTSDGVALGIFSIDTANNALNVSATGYTQVLTTTYSVGSGSPGLTLTQGTTTAGTANTPTFTWTDSDQVAGALLQLNLVSATGPSYSSTPALTGNGALTLTTSSTGQPAYSSAPALSGSGTLGSTGVKSGTAITPTVSARVVGIPDATSGVVTVNTANATSVRLKVGTDSAVTQNIVFGTPATPNAQGDSRLTVSGLTTSTRQFYYRVAMTDSNGNEVLDTVSTVGKFRTAPTGPSSFNFVFGSCANAVDSPTFTAMAARGDDMFLHLGDLYYADGSGTGIANFRTKYNTQLTASTQQALYATTPSLYTPSDHDSMNDNTGAGDDPTALANWNQVYREKWPYNPSIPATNGVYFTYVWGRARFIVLDGRSFKSPLAATDDASKTKLGTVQKQWLKDTINAATEPLIFIAQESPWQVTVVEGDDNWAEYGTEHVELANFFAASKKKLIMLGGDMHALAGATSAMGGVVLFQAAPFENASSVKGGPYDVGPYPAVTDYNNTYRQYGRVAVTDDGINPIKVDFSGYSSDNTLRMTLSTSAGNGTVALSGSGGLGAVGAMPAVNYSGTAALSGSGSLGAATPVPHGPAGSWNLVFNDEFNGNALNTNVWDPAEGYNVNNVTTTAANISVANGSVALNLASSTSGAEIFTKNAIFKVGDYVEFRALFPGDGTWLYNWPALWTSGPNWPTSGEIDFAEVLGIGADGSNSNDVTVNYHHGTTVNVDNSESYGKPAGVGYLGDVYRTYGVHRKPTSFDVYYDGVKVMADVPTSDNGGPQNIIANMGTHISTGPNQAGKALLVDYVRQFSPLVAIPTVSANVNLSGAGSLGTSVKNGQRATVALSGTGGLGVSASALAKASASVATSGSGTLTATATAVQSSSATINVSGAGTLATTATVLTTLSTALTGTGGLSAGTALTNFTSTVALNGSGGLSSSVRAGGTASVALSGAGALTDLTKVGTTGPVALTGSGALLTATANGRTAVVNVSGSGALTIGSVIAANAPVTLSGAGGLSAAQKIAVADSIDFDGSGGLNANTRAMLAQSTAFTGDGALSAATWLSSAGYAAFSGDGELSAVGSLVNTALTIRGQRVLRAYYGTTPVQKIYSNGEAVALA